MDGEFVERRKAANAEVVRVRIDRPFLPRRILLYASLVLAVVLAVALLQPGKPERALTFDLQSREGELTAVWDQQMAPEAELQSAVLSILDGAKEQTMDLTRNYTPHGRITVRPQSRDVVFTLRVQYAGEPLLSRGATYTGFVPHVVTAKSVPPPIVNAELDGLRKRNKELEEAVAALKKHFLPSP